MVAIADDRDRLLDEARTRAPVGDLCAACSAHPRAAAAAISVLFRSSASALRFELANRLHVVLSIAYPYTPAVSIRLFCGLARVILVDITQGYATPTLRS